MISEQFLISIPPIIYNNLFMKIIRIFGIVVGIHLVLVLAIFFVTPGCSSTGKPVAAVPAGAQSKPADSVPTIAVPNLAVAAAPAAPLFQPIGAGDPPAVSSGGVVFYSPTRPGTAAATAVEAQPVAGVTPATTYTVERGDSWWTIAKKDHLKVSDLAAANNLKPSSTLQPGQKLLIPSRALSQDAAVAAAETSPAPAAAPARPPAGVLKHVVKRGETLGSIAHAYGLKQGDLAAANAISDPGKIRPGQELIIPAGGHPVKPARTRSGPSNNGEGPASRAAPDNSAPAGSGLPPPLPAPDMGSGTGSGPGADVPVIRIEPSAQPVPANPPK